MTDTMLAKLFEHNNWANQQIIQACSALSDEQLDAEPHSVTKGTIRQTLMHLVASQQGYLSLLTLPVEARRNTPRHLPSCSRPRWPAEKACWPWCGTSPA